ncbi:MULTISPECIES: carboxymuconolactone decarboxylase family protein [Nostocales]|uniref:Carboxymuconolactone decarboxylase n=3 Tax=Nostocales TaxID=1161 RepID=A0A0C1RJT9_9CYAN|nr:peroxidase-related enzyme [Tolypothrix bouteillei]KAF3890402.1 peroxidase-related enzyme [Tolypothrix bouteillei VB521301]
MAEFPVLEYEQLSDLKAKEIYQEIQVELGFGIVPNLFKSMAINSGVLEANWKKFRATVLQGTVPRTLKEMLGIAISQANSSPYALNVHLHALSSLGMSEEVLKTLVSNFAACPLPTREKAVISFGLKAATEPHNLSSQDFQKLREFGLDDSEIFEIIATADLFTSINRYTDSIALEIDKL